MSSDLFFFKCQIQIMKNAKLSMKNAFNWVQVSLALVGVLRFGLGGDMPLRIWTNGSYIYQIF